MPVKTNGFKPSKNGHQLIEMDCNTLLEKPFVPEPAEPTEPAPVEEEQPAVEPAEEPEEELSAEELLLQTKAETQAKETALTPEEESEETEETAITKASDAIANKTQEQVAKLVKASAQKSKANRLTGMQMAQKDLKEIKEGYNLQMIAGLTALNEDTAIDLSEQLNLLSVFTDEQTGEQTNKELEELLTSDDPKLLEEFSKKLTQTLGKKGKQSTSGLSLLPEN